MALAAAVLFASVPAAHTAQTAQSSIEGRVATGSGVAMAAVTVTVAGSSLQAPSLVRTTDGGGRYRFMALPPGTYAVTFQSSGFQTITYERVLLPAGGLGTLDVSMVPGEVRDPVRIRAAVVPAERRTTMAATTFERGFLQALPGVEDAWLILQISPGVLVESDSLGATAGDTEANLYRGQASRNLVPRRPTLDGVEVQSIEEWPAFIDDRTLETVRVVPMGNDARSAAPGPGFAALLKPGGNSRRVNLFVAGEHPQWQWDNVTSQLRAQGVHESRPLDRYYDASADAGGRIATRRLWFYAAIRKQETRRRIIGYDGTHQLRSTSLTGKVTAQPKALHQVNAFVQGQTRDQPEHGGGPYRPVSSTNHRAVEPRAGRIEWTWTVSDRTLVNAFAGRSDSRTTSHPNTDVPSTYDLATFTYGGAFKTSSEASPSSDRHNRSQYAVTWSRDRLSLPVGDHRLQSGLQLTTEERTQGVSTLGNRQDYLLRFSNGVPDDILLYNVPVVSTTSANTQSVYAQDDWRASARATLNVGVRFDRWHLFLPAQGKPAGTFADLPVPGFGPHTFPRVALRTWTAVVPRLSVAYALTGDAKTTVKAGWARFADPLDVEGGERHNPNALVAAQYQWNDGNGNRRYEEGELGAFIRTVGGRVAQKTHGDLRQPTTDELTVAFERALARTLSLRVGYEYRRAHDLIQNVNLARPYSAYTVPVNKIDPGPDGTVGTWDDGRALVVYDYDPAFAGAAFEDIVAMNTPGNRAVLHRVEATVNARVADGSRVLASCLAARHGQWRNGVPQDPNTATFFPWSDYREWECKVSGSHQLPLGIRAAAVFTHRSGDAEARDVRFTGLKQARALVLPVEPMGAIRLPNQYLLNVRVEKRQRLGGHREVAFQADVLNALNASTATAVVTRSGSSYGRITAIVAPRSIRLGARCSF